MVLPGRLTTEQEGQGPERDAGEIDWIGALPEQHGAGASRCQVDDDQAGQTNGALFEGRGVRWVPVSKEQSIGPPSCRHLRELGGCDVAQLDFRGEAGHPLHEELGIVRR
jgi:hypothetical protein